MIFVIHIWISVLIISAPKYQKDRVQQYVLYIAVPRLSVDQYKEPMVNTETDRATLDAHSHTGCSHISWAGQWTFRDAET